ncbi:nitroreductase [Ideonella azotifigens]|uniref:Putative NAD(P)H nitroreductase n=2 Tax=Ideonella azotifigens TaxID=513160 RepID=A0ABN1KGE2_9BURK|nr:nitroreductase [Ideonella azotifigens]MCD2340482.1 nitroreductase [Ideonella azotifigens]
MTSDASPEPATMLAALMQSRQHTGPKHLVEPGPGEVVLRALFSAAATAPDHGRLLPWRFIVLGPEGRKRLSHAFAEALHERDPAATEDQLADARAKAARGPVLVLAIARLQSGHEQVPPEEQLVSLGAAIQNLLLAAEAHGFASGLSSGRGMRSDAMRRAFELAEGEQAICCITLGTALRPRLPRPRPPMEAFVFFES